MSGIVYPELGKKEIKAVTVLQRINTPLSRENIARTYAKMTGQNTKDVRELVEAQLDRGVQYGCVMRVGEQFAAIPVGTFVLAAADQRGNAAICGHVDDIPEEDVTWRDIGYHTGKSMKYLWFKMKRLGLCLAVSSCHGYEHIKDRWTSADVGRRFRCRMRDLKNLMFQE